MVETYSTTEASRQLNISYKRLYYALEGGAVPGLQRNGSGVPIRLSARQIKSVQKYFEKNQPAHADRPKSRHPKSIETATYDAAMRRLRWRYPDEFAEILTEERQKRNTK